MSTGPTGGAPPTGEGAPPVCPRHPARVSYVRCQRCDRPVCPECQRDAAVGVQCVDCVRTAARSAPTARTVFGGQVTGQRPTVTYALIGVTVVAFLLQQAVPSFTSDFGFFPPYALSEPWRFMTSGFLHSTGFLLHIAFNMFALWTLGPYLERLFGHAQFLAVYLVSVLGGSVGYFLIVPADGGRGDGWVTTVVGASGAVFGLFGALLVANRRLGRDSGPMIGVLAVNLVLGFVVPGIAWQAHVGGFLTGAACAAVLARTATARRTPVQVAGLALVVVLLALLVAVKTAFVPAGLLV